MTRATRPGPQSALRVLHVRNSHLLGGPERLLLGQVAHRAADVEVQVASFVTHGAESALLEAVRTAGGTAIPLSQRGSYDLRLAHVLAGALEEARPDVVVGHDYKANAVLRRALRRVAVPHVAVVHGYTGEDRKVRLFEALDRRGLRRAQAVLAVSEGLRDVALAAGVAPERAHVVPNAVDADAVQGEASRARDRLRRGWGFGPETAVVLALGRLSPEKGHADLLEAFARVLPRVPHARLVLVGDGASRKALERRAARPDLTGRVTFAGWRGDPWACLGAADHFVLPSLREGLPLALLEALAAGVPVVATRVGGVPAALEEGRFGRLVVPGDLAGLAQGLQATLAGAPLAANPRAAQAHVRAQFGIAAQVGALEAHYRTVAGTCTRAVRTCAPSA